jgi:DNA ligase 1
MKPMLASAVVDLNRLSFPLWVSPKLDGVRCLIIDGVAMSRSLKPIPNKHVQKLFGRRIYNGLDGELIVGAPNSKDTYRNTTSGVMSVDGKPDVVFHVFDEVVGAKPYSERLSSIRRFIQARKPYYYLQAVEHTLVDNPLDLMEMEETYLAEGYEGVMLRSPEGPYKHGRSTEKEGWLLKLKRFEDGEAEILAVQQFMHNGNKAKRNALGQLERSSHKANKVPLHMLGALQVKDLKSGVVFDIGTGFDERQRVDLWDDRAEIIGQVVKYKFQPTGVKDKPRFPVFLGFRSKEDM